MKAPEDYYQAEVRDGFYVPSEMKRCWAATIGVLEVIDRICRKHNLRYYAEYGTLLGAVRHKGFIPWDDDFDISMKRSDYLLFLKVARDEMPEDYQLLSVYNNPEYDNFLSRVVNRNFISVEKDFLEANHNFPFAVGVDIFPLDYFDYNESENRLIKDMILSAQAIISYLPPDVSDIDLLNETARSHINSFCQMCGMPLEKGKPIRQQIFILIERVCAIYDSNSSYLTNMYFWVKNGNQVYRKEYFENILRVPFEFFEISIPIGYDAKLCECYGINYMTPVKGGGMHDYPLYDKQKNLLFETTGKYYYPRYEFSEGDVKRQMPSCGSLERTRKEVVFLPYRAKYWPYMEKEWEKAAAAGDTDVYVIPIPYYDKGVYGINGDIHYEADDFPDYVPITPFDRYDFDKRQPDRIVIQNPYDEFDNAITVHPRFYTKRLLEVTKELVYIPYFNIDDNSVTDEKSLYTAGFFVRTPGVIRADRIYLQSEAVKNMYIDKLCEFAGQDTRSIWEAKIVVREDLVPEKTVGIREEDIPDEWWKYLLDEHGEGKKVILYYTNINNIVRYKEKAIDKIERVLELLKTHKDVLVPIWYTQPQMQDALETWYPDLWEMFVSVLQKYLTDDYGIYDDREDYSHLVAISDAYYGDRDAIMHDFMDTGRPVMTANYDI
ncbi:MAG: LicD family protein [Lachnospiraceae bacterium]|nr:LicD family protein [Lachnospiraceae bacterium]